jgi:hypothetical protein
MEITDKLDISEEHLYSLEMHSFINILTLMYNQMFMLQEESEYPDIFVEPMEMLYELAEGVKLRDRTKYNPGKLREYRSFSETMFKQMEQMTPRLKRDEAHLEMKSIFAEIVKVLSARLDDMLLRWTDPYKWVIYWLDDFKDGFLNHFYALEKNSAGYYKVVLNIAKHPIKDYNVTFTVKSVLRETITIPVTMKDVMRDIVTNARKYSAPGGNIDISVIMERNKLIFEVKDTGFGIPADEIAEVVKYKYRASNIIDRKEILGNGFGLTKANYSTQKLGGKMFIDSTLGKGTKVRIEIPVPDAEYVNASFGAG